MALKVGLLVGREWSFPPAFIEEVNKRDEGVVAEYVKLGGTRMDERIPYAVLTHGAEVTLPAAFPLGRSLVAGPLRSADVVFTNSRHTTRAVERLLGRPARFLGVGVDTEAFRRDGVRAWRL